MSAAAHLLLPAAGAATIAGAALAIAVCRAVQRAAARYSHEVRAALTGACIALESADGLDPGKCLSAEQRSALALGELRRAGRLMRSLEESASRSLPAQAAHRLRGVVAQLRRRRLEREGRFDPREETLALVHVWRMMARACDRTLRFEWRADDRVVLGRRDHYVQALSNLLGNALRHGEGAVAVRAESTSSHLRVSVTDEGDGLPEPLRRLTRGRSRQRHGHGLPVAAWAVRRLGGTLASAPAPLGARLVIELPLDHDLVGDGTSDWYAAARASLDELDRERRNGRVIPFRRPGAGPGGSPPRARGSQR